MPDRPIPFVAPLILALLAGTKTQTRRLLRRTFREFGPSTTAGYDWHFRDAGMRWHDLRHVELLARLPYAVGDRLWVREAHYLTDDGDHERAVYASDADAAADHLLGVRQTAKRYGLDDKWLAPHVRLRSSVHMPRWASRLTLTVTDVQVQRLQYSDGEVAMVEGAQAYVLALTFTVAQANIDA